MAASATSSPSPVKRKPVPLHDVSPVDRLELSGERPRPLGGDSLEQAPRLRQPPGSPVRVKFKPDDWATPSNAAIENADPVPQSRDEQDASLEKEVPKSPQDPTTTPPHEPLRARSQRRATDDEPARQRPTGNIPAKEESVGLGVHNTSNIGMANKEDPRNSRESDETARTSQQQTSAESSATTSASSVFGVNEVCDSQSVEVSPEGSVSGDNNSVTGKVPRFRYHHSSFQAPTAVQDLSENATHGNRRLTPILMHKRNGSLPRPPSTYSIYSDLGPRGSSPFHAIHNRVPSGNSRRSPDVRPSSFAELLNVPYPQPGPAPITLDNSQLRNAIGNNASLLSTQKTLEMYRQNVKKTNDFSIQYSFAVFLIATAQEQGLDLGETKRTKGSKPSKDHDQLLGSASSPHDLIREARTILQKLANNGYPFAQYYLADGYASGLFGKGKEDYNSAFPLFVLAAKHGHAESAYRTGLCYEFGWGCRSDPSKAVQFLRTAASKRHPGAMTRLGKACLSGDLGEKRYREGLKWLKLATEAADAMYNAAPYHLGCLYETGYGDDVFRDEGYAAELFTQAADLGHAEANFRMGEAYEHGRLSCPRDPALSVHFYTGAADRGHAEAMMGLCAWYMVGAEPILDKDEEEAYEWARRSADLGFIKAQYAVGYFTETGIGCRRDMLEANVWYVKAAEAGDDRARQRLAAIRAAISGGTPMEVAPPKKVTKHDKDKDKECVVM